MHTQEVALSRKAAGSPGSGPRPRRRGSAKYRRVIVKRLMPGPVDMGAMLSLLGKRRRSQYRKRMAKEKHAYIMQALALFWANGRRSIAEIAEHVGVELGYTNPDFLKFYFDTLAEPGPLTIAGR